MRAKEFIRKYQEQMLEDIIQLVNIPSFYDPETASEGKPFGDNVAKGLDWILQKAESMGFTVKNYDGYAGEVTIGRGDHIIGILVHEDVVPAGEGWETDPFHAVIKDNKLYGRGTSDDKGPLVSSLYAMKYLDDEGLIPPTASLRMIIGTNEEELWEGIEYYKKQVSVLPSYSIVPDGYFPLVFCEKGLIDLDLELSYRTAQNAKVFLKSISGGEGRNVVPGKAKAVLGYCGIEAVEVISSLQSCNGITAEVVGDDIEVLSKGKSTHAMAPENGINAISQLFEALGKLGNTLDAAEAISTYNQYIGMSYNGERFDCEFEDELSGKLTFNIGKVVFQDGNLVLESNMRYPASMKKQEVVDAIEKTCKQGEITCKEIDYLPPVYTEPDSPFVSMLMEVYRGVTGDQKTDALTIGGATYARSIPNAVVFGPLFPWEKELAHEANEFLDLDSLEQMTEIFIKALQALLNMKES